MSVLAFSVGYVSFFGLLLSGAHLAELSYPRPVKLSLNPQCDRRKYSNAIIKLFEEKGYVNPRLATNESRIKITGSALPRVQITLNKTSNKAFVSLAKTSGVSLDDVIKCLQNVD